MNQSPELTFFHAPHTRSGGVLILLEELGVPYKLHLLNMKAGDQRKPEYLAINPMGKVPAIMHGDALVTEQVAVYLYLADQFAQAGLAPAIGDALRGPYLRWLAFYGSSFEPALIDKHQKSTPPPSMAPYGDYDTMLKTLTDSSSVAPGCSANASAPPTCCGARPWPGPRCSSSCPSCRSSRPTSIA